MAFLKGTHVGTHHLVLLLRGHHFVLLVPKEAWCFQLVVSLEVVWLDVKVADQQSKAVKRRFGVETCVQLVHMREIRLAVGVRVLRDDDVVGVVTLVDLLLDLSHWSKEL